MIKITQQKNFTYKQDRSHFTSFVIEPLEVGQAITLGNAIRRTLFADITGYGITGVRINDLKSLYSSSPSIREDIIEILFNLKEIIFKESIFQREKTKHIENFGFPAYFEVQGPVIVTAGMLNLPKNTLAVLNPDHYICTILDTSEFFCEIDIQKGKNSRNFNPLNILHPSLHFSSGQSKTLEVEGIFCPVKNVNYTINLIYDKEGNLKESLTLEILTRGNLSPTRCFQEACKILIDMLFSLIFDSELLKSTSELSKAFDDFYEKEKEITYLTLKNNSKLQVFGKSENEFKVENESKIKTYDKQNQKQGKIKKDKKPNEKVKQKNQKRNKKSI